ncbi:MULTISPECIES: hypothetical protein [Nocardia]|uniref:hypothetical protein n=1 Tax=Nocardia TaxID=1817 RepID=UPI0018938482|nr:MULTISPECIES: hypothetical protein [Nocardia]MBF6349347.1 hypothetical protein [Nocardia flavorosea]
MLMDVGAVQRIAGDLRGSAVAVDDAAVRVADTLRGFDASCTGRDYGSVGEQLYRGLDGVRRSVFAWANCVQDCGSALQASADNCAGVDQSTAINLGAVAGVFE